MPKKTNGDDLFSEKNEVPSNWMAWNEIGDKIQGTLVSKRVVYNQLQEKDQTVYEILTADGEYWNVGGKPAIDAQMRNVKQGQIVGFKFVETRESKKKGFNPTKVIKVYAGPMNDDWLGQQQGDEITMDEIDEKFRKQEK